MSEIFSESFVMQRDSERAKTAYWVIAVLVALAMFVAASGSGSDMPMGDRTTPGWLDVLGNVFAVVRSCQQTRDEKHASLPMADLPHLCAQMWTKTDRRFCKCLW